MAIASIKAWLSQPNPDYSTGVALYDLYGPKLTLKIFFKNGTHQQRLRDALEDLADSNDSHPIPTFNIKTAKAVVPGFHQATSEVESRLPELESIPVPVRRHSLSDEEWERTPDQIKDLYTKVSRLKSRSDMAFHRLFVATSDAQRLELALSRLSDNDEINRTWKQIRDYQASGKITEQLEAESVKCVDKLSIKELFAVVTNYPTYITKANKRISGYSGQKLEKAKQELKEKEIYLAAARRRVDNE